jgi:hypothetical protein
VLRMQEPCQAVCSEAYGDTPGSPGHPGFLEAWSRSSFDGDLTRHWDVFQSFCRSSGAKNSLQVSPHVTALSPLTACMELCAKTKCWSWG